MALSFNKIIAKADEYHHMVEGVLAPLNKALEGLLEDNSAQVFYQTDGWCIGFDYNYGTNTPTGVVDFNKLMKMNKDDAIEYLVDRAI